VSLEIAPSELWALQWHTKGVFARLPAGTLIPPSHNMYSLGETPRQSLTLPTLTVVAPTWRTLPGKRVNIRFSPSMTRGFLPHDAVIHLRICVDEYRM